MKITKTDNSVLEVRFSREGKGERPLLFIADVHFDNPKCDRELLKKHFDEAKKKNALIACLDFFCAMEGKYDPRRAKSNIRPEYNRANYVDCIVNDAISFLDPYKDNLLCFTEGNHETAILKNLETDLLERLIGGLGGGVQKLGYLGYINFYSTYKDKGQVRSKRVFFHHGKWGGVVTKGALSVLRYASICNNADIIVSGHTHDQFSIPHAYYDVDQSGRLKVKEIDVLKCGTYKEEFEKGSGWASEKIVIPKVKRQWWVNLEWNTAEMWHTIQEAR